jgi:hypothetical protein
MSRKAQGQFDEDPELAAQIDEAMAAVGWRVPVTDDEVARAEEELATAPVAMPDVLADPARVFAWPGREDAPRVIAFPADAEADTAMSRAAREGGRLTPEVRETMRRDRQAAQESMDKDHGPDAR